MVAVLYIFICVVITFSSVGCEVSARLFSDIMMKGDTVCKFKIGNIEKVKQQFLQLSARSDVQMIRFNVDILQNKLENVEYFRSLNGLNSNGLQRWMWMLQKYSHLLSYSPDFELVTLNRSTSIQRNIYLPVAAYINSNETSESHYKLCTESLFSLIFKDILNQTNTNSHWLFCHRFFEGQEWKKELLYKTTGAWIGYDFECFSSNCQNASCAQHIEKGMVNVTINISILVVVCYFPLLFLLLPKRTVITAENPVSYSMGDCPFSLTRYLLRLNSRKKCKVIGRLKSFSDKFTNYSENADIGSIFDDCLPEISLISFIYFIIMGGFIIQRHYFLKLIPDPDLNKYRDVYHPCINYNLLSDCNSNNHNFELILNIVTTAFAPMYFLVVSLIYIHSDDLYISLNGGTHNWIHYVNKRTDSSTLHLNDKSRNISISISIPSPSINDSSTIPNPSINDSSTIPNPIINDSSTIPNPSFNDSSTIPNPSISDSSTIRNPSINNSSTIPNPSINESSMIPNPSINDSSTIPSPSINDSSTIPSPIINDSSTIPNSSINYSSTILNPSINDSSTIPNPSINDSSTIPNPSINDSSTIPNPSINDFLSIPNPSGNNGLSTPCPKADDSSTLSPDDTSVYSIFKCTGYTKLALKFLEKISLFFSLELWQKLFIPPYSLKFSGLLLFISVPLNVFSYVVFLLVPIVPFLIDILIVFPLLPLSNYIKDIMRDCREKNKRLKELVFCLFALLYFVLIFIFMIFCFAPYFVFILQSILRTIIYTFFVAGPLFTSFSYDTLALLVAISLYVIKYVVNFYQTYQNLLDNLLTMQIEMSIKKYIEETDENNQPKILRQTYNRTNNIQPTIPVYIFKKIVDKYLPLRTQIVMLSLKVLVTSLFLYVAIDTLGKVGNEDLFMSPIPALVATIMPILAEKLCSPSNPQKEIKLQEYFIRKDLQRYQADNVHDVQDSSSELTIRAWIIVFPAFYTILRPIMFSLETFFPKYHKKQI